jgi:hypothetical protein
MGGKPEELLAEEAVASAGAAASVPSRKGRLDEVRLWVAHFPDATRLDGGRILLTANELPVGSLQLAGTDDRGMRSIAKGGERFFVLLTYVSRK